MEINGLARSASVSDGAEQSDEEEMITRISRVILDARDALEDRSEEEARAVFDRMSECIHGFSTRGTNKDETMLERRMGQLVSFASEFEDVFNMTSQMLLTNERNTMQTVIGAYQFVAKAQVAQVASRQKPQAQHSNTTAVQSKAA